MGIQTNVERIINGFQGLNSKVNEIESNVTENYVEKTTLEPIAKAAFQEYPFWEENKQYLTGDLICIKNRQNTVLNAKCVNDFISAKDNSNNNTGWEADIQLGNIQITPVLNSTVGGPAWALMKGYTLDAWEIENTLNNAYTKIGELNNLQTTSKDNLVNAINEVKNSSGGGSTSNWESNDENTYIKDYNLSGYGNYCAVGIGSGNQVNYGNNVLIVGQSNSVYNFRHGIICGDSCSTESQFDGVDLRFKIGDGSGQDAFNVNQNGVVNCKGQVNSQGADYAEYFQWEDMNQNKEERKRLFVSLNKDKIRIAKNDNEYILGIISTKPALVGNCGLDRNTNEWGIVGLLGQLEVKDNGLCIPGEMCSIENGIAIPGNKYYVMERLENNLIKVLFK